MNGNARIMFAVLGVVVVAASGCANKEVVKKDEPIAPQTVKAQPAKPAAQTATAPLQGEQMKQPAATGANASANAAAFESVYFAFDKADLSPADRDVLSKNAATMLKAKPGVKVKIEGNCD